MKRVGAVLSPFVKSLGIEGALKLEELKRAWPTLFGEPLSLHMSPSSLKEGELLITVDSPVWLQQISFYKPDILKKLGPFDVRDIRFRLGTIRIEKNIRSRPRKAKREKSLDSDTLSFIEETVSELEDPGLKESIRKAMGKAFSSRVSDKERSRPYDI
ncbi:MAG TPA: DUF721 domain-containing protein [Thermodesulfovibrionales bacterium]|nr:DUF721 domain-containing protein [Thermodesulfovibrionales bacterium]